MLLHELGHSLVAQRFGIPISGINLHLLGGLALMRSQPRTPRQEFLIAAAGPAVSLLLAVGFTLLAWLSSGSLVVSSPTLPDLLAYGAVANGIMAVFNLVPALPMDGGRIFRALLATQLGHRRATNVAAFVSRVLSGGFVLLGLFFGSWSLALIGVFVFMMAGREKRSLEREYPTSPGFGFDVFPGFEGVADARPSWDGSPKFERGYFGRGAFGIGRQTRPREASDSRFETSSGGPVIDVSPRSSTRPRIV